MRAQPLVLLAVVSSLALFSSAAARAKVELDAPVVLTQVPRQAHMEAKPWDSNRLMRDDWFEGARIVVVSPRGEERALSEGFVSACDPNVSFDARHVVFAGKKDPQAHWRVWEIGIDGKNPRPVSPENQEARSPIYATTLFTLDSPEPWFTVVYVARENSVAESGNTTGSSLYNIKLDGTEPRRLTFNPNHNLDPFQMWDGRVLYSAERYPLEPDSAFGRVGLHSVHIVGTDMVFYGGEDGKRIQHMPCATDERTVVFVESDEAVWDGAGQLASVREQRPHHTYRPLTNDPNWVYLYPSPWHNNRLLVSRRPANGQAACEVCCFDADNGQCEALLSSSEYHEVQAQVLRARPKPDGHSTVVEPGKYTTGTLYGLNCYDADEKMLPHLPKGTFKRLRVVEGVPVDSRAGSPSPGVSVPEGKVRKGPLVPRRVLGEAPIEADGSFNIELPADTPVLLQPLDERGLALRTCGWISVKPRESRGCVGCHEDPELVPENNYVLALRRFSTKVLTPPNQRRNVSFRETIAPILESRCASVGCHGAPDSPVYLPLTAEQPTPQDLQQAYATLLSAVEGGSGRPSPVPQKGKYVDAGRARTSPLVWRLFGMDTSRPWDHVPPQAAASPRRIKAMPPPDKGGPLSDEEMRKFVEWIDLGAAWEALPDSGSQTNATVPTEVERR